MAPTSSAKARRRQLNEEFIERAFDGRHRDVQRLLESSVDLEAVERNGYTALSEASIAGHTVVVGQLIRALADPNSQAQDGRTPLHRAAVHGWQPVVKLLLDNGADPSVTDKNGATPASLAKGWALQDLINDFPPERTKELLEERKRKLAELPPPVPQEEEEEEEPEQEAETAAEIAKGPESTPLAGGALNFAPPPRVTEKPQEEQARQEEALRKAKYQEAIAEIEREYGVEEATAAGLIPDPYSSKARLRVTGAGDARLNGVYRCRFADKARVEFEKVDDTKCQISWTEWENEWRMLCVDYKMGSTLYRHKKRPNVKAEDCHGVPEGNWQLWFGKAPEASVQRLDPNAVETEADSQDVPAAPKEADTGATEPGDHAGEGASGGAAGEEPKRSFIELRSRLEIVKSDEGGAGRRATGASGASVRKQVIGLGGQKIVETADGLFDADEVPEEDGGRREAGAGGSSAIEEMSMEECAATWLDDLDYGFEVPPSWEPVQAAKATAQDLFKEGKVFEALRATTAALKGAGKLRVRIARRPKVAAAAARRAANSDDDEEDEDDAEEEEGLDPNEPLPKPEAVEQMIGILYSNRSLLMTSQIQAHDKQMLEYGVEAAWHLVVADTNAALKVDPGNFKASFRRAQARFELGELDEALADATRVVDHYARNCSTPNPEAAALRDKILAAAKKERSKWGEQGSSSWNRGAAASANLISEVSATSGLEQGRGSAPTAAWDVKPRRPPAAAASATVTASAARGPAAPRNGADVEKALLNTLKSDESGRVAYAKQHLTPDVLRRLYRRTPLGPDLLAVVISALYGVAADDASHAESALAALAATPSAATHAAMFDKKERAALEQLLGRLRPEAAAAWERAPVAEPIGA